eukprot:g78077.t1
MQSEHVNPSSLVSVKLKDTKAAALQQRFEEEIRSYTGSDPLSKWLDYIAWVDTLEKTADPSVSESERSELKTALLDKCLQLCSPADPANSPERCNYSHDVRFLDLWLVKAKSSPDPIAVLQKLRQDGIGAKLAKRWTIEVDLLIAQKRFTEAKSVLEEACLSEASPKAALTGAELRLRRLLQHSSNVSLKTPGVKKRLQPDAPPPLSLASTPVPVPPARKRARLNPQLTVPTGSGEEHGEDAPEELEKEIGVGDSSRDAKEREEAMRAQLEKEMPDIIPRRRGQTFGSFGWTPGQTTRYSRSRTLLEENKENRRRSAVVPSARRQSSELLQPPARLRRMSTGTQLSSLYANQLSEMPTPRTIRHMRVFAKESGDGNINEVMDGYSELLGEEKTSKIKNDLVKACRAAVELLTTEETYVNNLKVLSAFVERLRLLETMGRPLLTAEEIKKIFLNIMDLMDMHQSLYKDLYKKRVFPVHDVHQKHKGQKTFVGDLLVGLGDVLSSYIPYFRLYITYVNDYDKAQKFLWEAREKNADFDFFIKFNEKAFKITTIESLLITPVQRLPRYLLLLNDIICAGGGASTPGTIGTPARTGLASPTRGTPARTGLGSPVRSGPSKPTAPTDVAANRLKNHGAKRILETYLALKKIASLVNESFRLVESRQRVVQYSSRVKGFDKCLREMYKKLGLPEPESLSLVTPSRSHVRSGVLQTQSFSRFGRSNSYSRRYFVVFNDILIYCSVPSNMEKGKLTCNGVMSMDGLKVECVDTNKDQPPSSPKDAAWPFPFLLTSTTEEFEVRAETEQERDAWMKELTQTASKMKETVAARQNAVASLTKAPRSGQLTDDTCVADAQKKLKGTTSPTLPPHRVSSFLLTLVSFKPVLSCKALQESFQRAIAHSPTRANCTVQWHRSWYFSGYCQLLPGRQDGPGESLAFLFAGFPITSPESLPHVRLPPPKYFSLYRSRRSYSFGTSLMMWSLSSRPGPKKPPTESKNIRKSPADKAVEAKEAITQDMLERLFQVGQSHRCKIVLMTLSNRSKENF